MRVSVVEPGRLVVTHVDEAGEELAPLRPLVWIGAEELGRLLRARGRSGGLTGTDLFLQAISQPAARLLEVVVAH